jgi:hypothetical protein
VKSKQKRVKKRAQKIRPPRVLLDLGEEPTSGPQKQHEWQWAWVENVPSAHHLFKGPQKFGLANAAWRTALCGAAFCWLSPPTPGRSCKECERREAAGRHEPHTSWDFVLDEKL